MRLESMKGPGMIPVVLLLSFVSLYPAVAEEKAGDEDPAWVAELNEKYPEAPAEIWDRYVKALKASEKYRFLQALRADRVKPLVEAWSKELGVRLKVDACNLMDFEDDFWSSVETPDEMFLRKARIKVGKRRVEIYHFSLKKNYTWTRFRVHPSRVKPLDFEYVTEIDIEHPMNRKLEKFSVQGDTLARIVSTLFKTASMDIDSDEGHDYAINAEAAALRITMKARNRTLRELLKMALGAAGWKITVDGLTPEDAFDNAFVSAEWAWKVYCEREEKLFISKPPGREPEGQTKGKVDWLDFFRELVFKDALGLKNKRHLIIMGP